MKEKVSFSRYQVFMTALLALIQFCVVLDFMVLSPLGTFVMKDLSLQPNQFAVVVSAYAFSAFLSALLTAGFADKFDRKRLLVFFFSGFIVGTLFCALSNSYETLLAARVFTGLFGGVMSSISYAIITDLYVVNQRGRVMGFIQMGFGVSQIVGIPLGLFLTNWANWHLPFYVIVGFAAVILVGTVIFMRPITAHLALTKEKNAFAHLVSTIKNKRYITGFLATTLLATGGFMLMPFGSDFAVQNLKLTTDELPYMYIVTGVFTFAAGPLAGLISDRFGRMNLFAFGTIISIAIVLIYTQLGPTPLSIVILLNVILFIGITARIVPAQAMMTSVPKPEDRGAFMSINSAVQQLSGGIASFIAGTIVYKHANGEIGNYPILGIVVTCSMIIAFLMMRRLHKLLNKD
ncbi:MAG: MFS transporter [Fluviicola sp.]|nr:MFS transporter [Fluviicola sp.]MBP6270995.1 MFS transporter [Fluviicola sp.]